MKKRKKKRNKDYSEWSQMIGTINKVWKNHLEEGYPKDFKHPKYIQLFNNYSKRSLTNKLLYDIIVII